MEKILIKIFVPSVSNCYELMVPKMLQLCELLPFINSVVEQQSDGQFQPTGKEILCTEEDGKILNINLTVHELGIQNGTTLFLI